MLWPPCSVCDVRLKVPLVLCETFSLPSPVRAPPIDYSLPTLFIFLFPSKNHKDSFESSKFVSNFFPLFGTSYGEKGKYTGAGNDDNFATGKVK